MVAVFKPEFPDGLLDRDLVERMEEIKEQEGVPKTWQVTKALRTYLQERAG